MLSSELAILFSKIVPSNEMIYQGWLWIEFALLEKNIFQQYKFKRSHCYFTYEFK